MNQVSISTIEIGRKYSAYMIHSSHVLPSVINLLRCKSIISLVDTFMFISYNVIMQRILAVDLKQPKPMS